MTENLLNTSQQFFDEIVNRSLEEGVADQEAYNQMVADVLEEHRGWAELHDDNDLEGLETTLKARWSEYQQRLDEKSV